MLCSACGHAIRPDLEQSRKLFGNYRFDSDGRPEWGRPPTPPQIWNRVRYYTTYTVLVVGFILMMTSLVVLFVVMLPFLFCVVFAILPILISGWTITEGSPAGPIFQYTANGAFLITLAYAAIYLISGPPDRFSAGVRRQVLGQVVLPVPIVLSAVALRQIGETSHYWYLWLFAPIPISLIALCWNSWSAGSVSCEPGYLDMGPFQRNKQMDSAVYFLLNYWDETEQLQTPKLRKPATSQHDRTIDQQYRTWCRHVGIRNPDVVFFDRIRSETPCARTWEIFGAVLKIYGKKVWKLSYAGYVKWCRKSHCIPEGEDVFLSVRCGRESEGLTHWLKDVGQPSVAAGRSVNRRSYLQWCEREFALPMADYAKFCEMCARNDIAPEQWDPQWDRAAFEELLAEEERKRAEETESMRRQIQLSRETSSAVIETRQSLEEQHRNRLAWEEYRQRAFENRDPWGRW